MNSWLRDSLSDMLRTNRHADCRFIIETSAGNKVFACHKLILSCASEVFDRMLFGSYNESTSGDVKLNDVEPKVFEKFREYVYSYDVERLQLYDFDTLVKLAEFGNKYLVESIKDDCVRQLLYRKDMFDADELLRLFQCAHTLNSATLIDQISRDLKNHAKRVLNHSAIYQFGTDVFKFYIEVVEGRLSEAERFNLIEMYIKFHELDAFNGEPGVTDTETDDDKKATNTSQVANTAVEAEGKVNADYISDLLGLIDFCKFTPKDFYEGPGKSSLLTMQQKYEHLYKIARACAHVAAQEELETKLGNCFLSSSCHPDHEVQRQYMNRPYGANSSRRADLSKPDMSFD
ncbi:kelch-like protein 7 isoform X1 [Drosophila hydei]|uniref:Kelch-like protein 7 isoform X1 n=1 Tax=Drosophila hydei TaxID=7224 RepID=A0A6J1LL25_DROHY|nr:kelch-like protein 7 isoform X1 [Drosophila hydei]